MTHRFMSSSISAVVSDSFVVHVHLTMRELNPLSRERGVKFQDTKLSKSIG